MLFLFGNGLCRPLKIFTLQGMQTTFGMPLIIRAGEDYWIQNSNTTAPRATKAQNIRIPMIAALNN